MIISLTDQRTDYICSFIIFDTNTGLEYRLDVNTRKTGDFGPHVELIVANSTPVSNYTVDGGSTNEYYGEAALLFWRQLKNITAGNHFARKKMEAVIFDGVKAARACLKLPEQVIEDEKPY